MARDERHPSQVTEDYWLYAYRLSGEYPEQTDNNGKWLIFIPESEIDNVWLTIKAAVEEGRLGSCAKVATSKPNPIAPNPKMKVICVYTYDYTDCEDVRNIRQELRNLGISWKIPYKSDKQTHAGNYSSHGRTRVSEYYE